MWYWWYRLKIWQKLALMVLLSSLPLWVLLYELLASQNHALDFARQERKGVEYLRVVRQLLQDAQLSQALAMTVASDDGALKNQLAAQLNRVDQDLQQLAELERLYGAEFQTTSAFDAMVWQWQALKRLTQTPHVPPFELIQLYTQFIDQTLNHSLLIVLGNGSQLILDPDVDSYWLMDTAITKLPELTARLSELRMYGVVSLSGQADSSDERASASLLIRIQTARDQVERNLRYAASANAGTGNALYPQWQSSVSSASVLLSLFDQRLVNSQSHALTPAEFLELASFTIDAQFQYYDRVIPALDQLLQARIAHLNQMRFSSLSIVGLSFLATLGLLLVVVRSITRPLSGLVRATQRVSLGDLRTRIKAKRGQDEVTQLARAFNEMAHALERRMQEQRQAEEKYRSIFENAVDGIFQSTPEGRFFNVNPAFARMLGYAAPAELIAHMNDIGQQLYVDPRQRAEFLRLLATQDEVRAFEFEVYRKDGSRLWLSSHARAVRDVQGPLLYIEGTNEDITARKQAEQALRESEERFAKAFHASPIAMSMARFADGQLLDINDSYVRLTGYTREELIGQTAVNLGMADAATREGIIRAVVERGSLRDWEIVGRRKSGEQATVLVSAELITVGGEACVLVAIYDITERKHAEEQIRASLKEKEVLLKEIHHRVKNNLQIITSLLSLQAQELTDPTVLAMFAESQHRVRSMALVHEQLYHSENLARIDFAAYTRTLTMNLFHAYGVSGRIGLQLNLADVWLSLDTAIPCGLLINELVSNALKHAFPDARAGEVLIGLDANSAGGWTLRVSDNGIGFPAHVDFREPSSLGLRLVNMLAYQLDGTLALECESGTMFVVTFAELKYQDHTATP
jgi:PAS domain S-box-containing protein